MNEPALTLADALTPEDVVAYLKANPDFFVGQQELLAELTLPHASGAAVSLVERQVSILRERNIEMRNRLGKLLESARDNDKLFDKTKRLTLSLLEGQDMGDIIDALYYSFDKEFGIHFTSLVLFGNTDTMPSSQARIVSAHEGRDKLASILKHNRAVCGQLDASVVSYLFGENATHIGSVATVPLLHGANFGVLAIANRDPLFYRSSMGTLFLSFIAEVLNRLLPRFIPR
jgi:uncharacterized protein YigA (DUF484 family)